MALGHEVVYQLRINGDTLIELETAWEKTGSERVLCGHSCPLLDMISNEEVNFLR